MKTIKEVAMLTGISVRTLQYYDEIGLFHPTKLTAAGYRLYDNEALEKLQQILFFKELDFSLKDIKHIMSDPEYNQQEAIKQQKALLTVKRDRYNRLLALLDKLEKGESCMDFEAFRIDAYLEVLKEFKETHKEDVIAHWGSEEEFDKLIKKCEEHGESIAKNAIEYYGSVENYAVAMKKNMENFSENMEKMENLNSLDYIKKNDQYMKELVSDLSSDIKDREVQSSVQKIVELTQSDDFPQIQTKETWQYMIHQYSTNDNVIKIIDEKYGIGASKYIGEALRYYFEHQKGMN